MMVPERWAVVAIVALSLVSVASGQSTTPAPAPHHAKSKAKPAANSNVVQPDNGAAPEQANDPDASTPLTQTPNYDPPPPPPRPPDPDPPAAPPVAVIPASAVTQQTPAQETPVAKKAEPPPPLPAPLRPMTAQEQQLEKDSTHLLALARELKDEVAKAGIDTLSLDALRKAEEIQRLSKDLKERLKLQAANSGSQTGAGAQ